MWTFEDLEIRKLARVLNQTLWGIFYKATFKNRSFQDQIMRASMSIWNNIAEWFERWSKKEFAVFLRYAKWSCGEVRQMLYAAEDFSYVTPDNAHTLRALCREISIKIYKFMKTLA
jgi:four helix bundle protein